MMSKEAEGERQVMSKEMANLHAAADGSQSLDGNAAVVNPAEFLSVLQTTCQQMQDRFTQIWTKLWIEEFFSYILDEMAERLNDLEKEVKDLVSCAAGIGDQQANKDTKNISPEGGPQ